MSHASNVSNRARVLIFLARQGAHVIAKGLPSAPTDAAHPVHPHPPVLSYLLGQAKHNFAVPTLSLMPGTVVLSTRVVAATTPTIRALGMPAKRARAAGDGGWICKGRSGGCAPGLLSVEFDAGVIRAVGPHVDDTLARARSDWTMPLPTEGEDDGEVDGGE